MKVHSMIFHCRELLPSRYSNKQHGRHILPMLPVLLIILLFPFLVMACSETPDQGPTYNELNAVVALSPENIWAVGDMSDSRYYGSRVLIEHWDGQHWHTAMPDLPGGLCSISALSPDDIWAVGAGMNCGFSMHLLTLHWDGRHWQQFSAPMPGNNQNKTGVLASVVALSRDNVWAVGFTSREAMIEHWNGSPGQ